MTNSFHSVPGQMFNELGDGGGGPAAVRQLSSGQYSKHLLLLRAVLDAAAKAECSQAVAAEAGYRLLADVQRHDPEAVHTVLSYPSVGAWAHRTLGALSRGPAMVGAEPSRLRTVAAAAAIRARFPAEIEVSPSGGLVALPTLGAAAVGGEDNTAAIVRSSPDGAEVTSSGAPLKVPSDPHQDAPGWLAVRRLRTGSLDVLLDDTDPFRMPAEATVTGHLDDANFEQWSTIMRDGWALLTRHHPDLAGELVAAIKTVVPLATPPEGQVSTSSVETFGAVALSCPPDPRTLGVTLVHEVQHVKLSALLNIVTLTKPDDGRLFYAPWRDDPRPANGLLQGAYAYVGVSRFWLMQRQVDHGAAGLRAHAEFAKWRAAAMAVVETLLRSDVLTEAGTVFVRRMAQTLRTWQNEPIPVDAQSLADSEAAEHLARWQSTNDQTPASST